MRFVLGQMGCWALSVLPRPVAAQELPADSRTVAARFNYHVVETTGLRIAQMDLGRIALDTNRFTAFVRNTSGASRILGLSLRAVPVLWVRANWQRGYRFEIPAHSQRQIEAAYVFRRMTPEATLRVSFGTPRDVERSIEVIERFYDTTLTVGKGNPAASDPRLAFDSMSTEHFAVFAWRGSAGARQLPAIAAARGRALRGIAEILALAFAGRIRLVLYPDSATKTSQTGHIGNGFAGGRMIVEIFNDSVQLDPYHEVAHIVAEELGSRLCSARDSRSMSPSGLARMPSSTSELPARASLRSPAPIYRRGSSSPWGGCSVLRISDRIRPSPALPIPRQLQSRHS
jgi:hypothetical protein